MADSHTPIIFITAHEDDDRRRQALEAGAVAFLHKPFYEEELLNAINPKLRSLGIVLVLVLVLGALAFCAGKDPHLSRIFFVPLARL